MKTFLVGGAVRDELLGLPVKDRDWVVTGATPEDMTQAGFRPVGQDFPVFLHPKTQEEYALARTERKSGHGYAGFTFHTSPDITLEEDLLRRDLTINAIAKDKNGNLVDPYNGQQDLKKRILRHVSPAFREDPLRILRVARFAARFAENGFTIAEDTRTLMQEMVEAGEAAWLVAERVWQETSRALESRVPDIYFRELHRANALQVVMPEIHENFASDNTLNVRALNVSAQALMPLTVRFACAVSTPSSDSYQKVSTLCTRMKVPVQFKDVAMLTAKVLPNWLESEVSPLTRLSLLQQTDGFRRPERFQHILDACKVLAKEHAGTSTLSEQLCQDLSACKQVDIQSLVKQGLKGKELAEAIQRTRLQALENIKT